MTRSFWMTVLLLCGAAMLLAQPIPVTRWSRVVSGDSLDVVTGLVQATDGTYLMCGYTQSWGNGGYDVYLGQLDSLGNHSWYRTYGGLYHDAALAIRATRDGNYVLAGYTQTRESGPLNVYVIKLSPIGTLLWNRAYVGVADEYANDIQQTFDGGYIITGSTDSGGPFNVYLRKTDAQGNPSWTRIINHNVDEGFSVQQTADSGYIIAGSTHYQQGDGYLIKTDVTGHVTWDRFIGQSGDEVFRAVRQTPDHGYIIAGKSNTGTATDRPYLVKTDSTGHVQWYHTYGISNASGVFYSVCLVIDTTQVNYVAAGVLDRRFYLVRTDSAGTMRWDEEYSHGSDDACAYTMIPTHDASYVLGGYTASASQGWDFYVLKTGRDHMTRDAVAPRSDLTPSGYALWAYPNPFNARTVVEFVLPRSAEVRLDLYDLNGRRVAGIAHRVYEHGDHRIGFDAAALPSGIYFARLTTPDFATTQKLMLLK